MILHLLRVTVLLLQSLVLPLFSFKCLDSNQSKQQVLYGMCLLYECSLWVRLWWNMPQTQHVTSVMGVLQQMTGLSNRASVKPHFPPPNVSSPKCLFNEFLKLRTAQKSMYSYVYVHHREFNNRQTTSTTNLFSSLKMSDRENSLYYIRICLVLSMLDLSHCHHSCGSTESSNCPW